MKVASIEVTRAIAIFCIILIHTGPFLTPAYTIIFPWHFFGQFVQQICSFAVPYFFLVAGYFFSLGVKKRGLTIQLKKTLGRIGFLLVIWIIIDGIFWVNWLQNVIESKSVKPLIWNLLAIPHFAIERFDLFVFRGTAVPLWFLISLINGIFILSFLLMIKMNKFLIILTALLGYIFTLSLSFYSHTRIGMGLTIPLEKRGIGLAFFFLTIGYFGGNNKFLQSKGTIILCLSIVLMFIESALLSFENGNTFIAHQYLFSTPLVAYGIFLISLQHPYFGANSLFYKIGEASLGIYLIHTPILNAMRIYRETYNNLIWESTFPFLIFITSFFIVFILKKVPFLRRAVT